jgi:hypothetical protein
LLRNPSGSWENSAETRSMQQRPIPQHMQGKSLLPLVKASDPSFRTEWYYEYYEWPNPEKVPPCRGIRTERYKLIQYVLGPQEFELYDLQNDPMEKQNL